MVLSAHNEAPGGFCASVAYQYMYRYQYRYKAGVASDAHISEQSVATMLLPPGAGAEGRSPACSHTCDDVFVALDRNRRFVHTSSHWYELPFERKRNSRDSAFAMGLRSGSSCPADDWPFMCTDSFLPRNLTTHP